MKYLSLFSGIGGFELGIEHAHEDISKAKRQKQRRAKRYSADHDKPLLALQHPACVGYSEIDKHAIQVYEKHFPTHKNYGDITKIKTETLPDFDLLVGGFPCQAFSVAGKRKGFQDTRGTLFFEIARILQAKRPRLFLLENVKGLLSHDNGATFKTIITTLAQLGYDLQWQVLNSKNHGVPQNRERVFIIGHLRETPRPQVFPFIGSCTADSEKRPVSTAIDANYGKGLDNHGARTGIAQISKTVRSSGLKSPHGSKQNWDSYEVNGKIRRLTPLECERLQGFPDRWTEGISDTQRYKCLGNAVTVNVVKSIMAKLLQFYE